MDLQEIAVALAERVGGKAPLAGTLKFDLGAAGTLFVDGNIVTANKNDLARCTIAMTADDFNELIHGRLQPTSAFTQGRMRVDGDMFLAMKLGQMV